MPVNEIKIQQLAGQFILTTAEVEGLISLDWFNLDYWQEKNALLASATGRAQAYFINTPTGEVVWRKYQRGGLPGKFIERSYLWLGLKNTRAYKELLLTQQLYNLGLPVPQPLAARVVKTGLTYQADLITRKLANSQTLADYLVAAFAAPNPDLTAINQQLSQVEATVRQFHSQGLNHTDLNPRNILIRLIRDKLAADVPRETPTTDKALSNSISQEMVIKQPNASRETPTVNKPLDTKKTAANSCWLIDFDNCSLGKPSAAVAKNNRQRLVRGLTKLLPEQAALWQQHFL